MSDRSHVEKAAAAGARKIELLLGDPARYLLRSAASTGCSICGRERGDGADFLSEITRSRGLI
jgi:hypothetical protein